jgi:hypothetical protein
LHVFFAVSGRRRPRRRPAFVDLVSFPRIINYDTQHSIVRARPCLAYEVWGRLAGGL